jgi:hypothetical protein
MRRIWKRVRDRPFEPLLAVAVGVFCSWAVLQSFVNASNWRLEPARVAAVVVGGTLIPVLVSLTPAPLRFARPSVEFFEGGAVTRAFVTGAVYGCASLAWGIAVVLLLGTSPADA